MRLFIGFAPVDEPQIRHRLHHRAWRATAHPQVQMARDILLFAQQRDPLDNAHRLSGQCRAADGRQRRSKEAADDDFVPMPPPSARCPLADKLLEVNWGLVLLITLIACAGFAMLYSVAGGHFQPWALPQIGPFHRWAWSSWWRRR